MINFTMRLFAMIAFLGLGNLAFSQTILWGGPDDMNGSFDGGLNDWTSNPVSDPAAEWVWDAEGDASEGAYWGTRGPIQSPSVDNGAAVFNSDFYDNNGMPDSFGLGPAPAPHVSELISPIIDLTGQTAVSLQFNQYYRNFQASTFVAFSNDGGNSWSDLIELNEDIAVNTETSPSDVQTIPLFGAGDTDQFRVKFVFDGEYYFWIVDDVAIVSSADFDLALGDFFYPPASYAQPAAMIDTDTMGFSVDVSNVGAAVQTDIKVTAQVLDGMGAILFEDSLIIPSLDAGVVDSTFNLPNQYVPEDLEVGDYTIRYEVSSANDDNDESDNVVEEQFLVTDDLFSKENGDPAEEVAFQPGGGGDFWVGNLYQTSPNILLNEYVASEGTFSFAANSSDPVDGKVVSMYLMRVDDDVDANWDNFDDQVTDVLTHPNLELVGLADITLTDEGNYEPVSLQLLDFNTIEPGVPLDPGARYFLLVSYLDDASTLFHTFNQEINYFQISTVVVSSQFFLGGFGPENAAFLRMSVDLVSTTDEAGRTLPDDVMTFYPNPVSDNLNVDIAFDKPVLANVTIADQNGRVIMIDELPNVTRELKQYNVSSLAAGNYILRIATEQGTLTKKFVVVR